MNYCSFTPWDEPCGKVAHFKIRDQWYCAEHYDAIVADHQSGCDGCALHDNPPEENIQ
jgi:hypothetical protein